MSKSGSVRDIVHEPSTRGRSSRDVVGSSSHHWLVIVSVHSPMKISATRSSSVFRVTSFHGRPAWGTSTLVKMMDAWWLADASSS